MAVSRLLEQPRSYHLSVLGLACVAFAVRLVALVILGPHIGPDSKNYLTQGNYILEQGALSFVVFAAEQSPLYSLLLAVSAAIAGPNAAWAVCVVQTILGSLTALLLAAFTLRVTGSRTAAVLTCGLTAVHIPFIFWTNYILTDTLLLFVLALIMVGLVRVVDSRHVLALGLLVSILVLALVLTRRTNVLTGAALVVLAAILGRTRPSAVLGLLIPVVLGAVILVGTGMRSRTGSALFDRADAYAWQSVYMGLQWTEQGRATEGVDVQLPDIPDDAQRAAFFRDTSLSRISSDPGFFLAQAGRKFKVLWEPYMPEDSMMHKAVSALYLLPLYALALVGWFTSRHRTLLITITTVGLLVFTLVCLITFVDYDQRYRLPAELFLLPLSAVGLEHVVSRLASVSPSRAAQLGGQFPRHGASAG